MPRTNSKLLRRLAVLTPSLALACCVPPADPEPLPPPPVQAPPPAPAPPPVVQEPVYENFLDAPQTPGDWAYFEERNETFAMFGTGMSNPLAIIRCSKQSGEVSIGRFGSSAASAAMQIRSETAMRVSNAAAKDSGKPLVAADFSRNDPILDAIALSRGRFAIGVEGQPTLYLPAWAEVTRVIEDCR
ncbi:hypothetical protein OAS19_04635 [Altererythrobacter sp.]|nr:hypothetical protein [Altererythrobacter sp.]